VPLFLWILANYFVATVSDGEGKLKDLYVGTIYALSPYLLLASRSCSSAGPSPITSNSFIPSSDRDVWLERDPLFRHYSEMHDYSFLKTIKNLLLDHRRLSRPSFSRPYVIYMMARQLFGYLASSL
jgi:hypothetical protein